MNIVNVFVNVNSLACKEAAKEKLSGEKFVWWENSTVVNCPVGKIVWWEIVLLGKLFGGKTTWWETGLLSKCLGGKMDWLENVQVGN